MGDGRSSLANEALFPLHLRRQEIKPSHLSWNPSRPKSRAIRTGPEGRQTLLRCRGNRPQPKNKTEITTPRAFWASRLDNPSRQSSSPCGREADSGTTPRPAHHDDTAFATDETSGQLPHSLPPSPAQRRGQWANNGADGTASSTATCIYIYAQRRGRRGRSSGGGGLGHSRRKRRGRREGVCHVYNCSSPRGRRGGSIGEPDAIPGRVREESTRVPLHIGSRHRGFEHHKLRVYMLL